MTYHVVLLVEQPLTELDARQVTSLHLELGDEVVYDVLLPVDDAAERVATAVGTLGSGDVVGSPSYALASIDLDELHDQSEVEAHEGLARTLALLRADGATAQGAVVDDHPIDALRATVAAVDAAEVIVLTSPHVVAEFFGVDWTSRARRHLDVPVLHLLEQETFAEQADGHGEGITGV
ncbi:hypothetical protein INN71_03700 [Nocardioides sp. ChNu-153]|uniref:hypothetical protein n=1 Tax=unclassified Nocardioides TaxID=2615069 RepID=UPI002404C6B2|nr:MULTISPECIES: hypothetical protein [unclassified Nocardioides]MDF9717179.1 hypothetical protein [Nocardioides sp. ChNu-99]MDN7120493.1 hypothetical protein [Nocardioides sp. ChNu-153]